MSLKLKIVSPEKVEFDDYVESVKVPGVMGSFEILDNHAPITTVLQSGVVEYATKCDRQQLPVSGGFVEVHKNEVCLCVEKTR